jgi:hypothetical protein
MNALYPHATDINVEQVLAADDETMLARLRAHQAPATTQPTSTESFIRSVLGNVADVTSIRTASQGNIPQVEVRLVPRDGTALAGYHRIENALRALMPDHAIVVPPPRAVPPPIAFDNASADLSAEQKATLADVAWAMRRWLPIRVEVIADSPDGASTLARRRANAVVAALQDGYDDSLEVDAAVSVDAPQSSAVVHIVPVWAPEGGEGASAPPEVKPALESPASEHE